MLCDLCVENLLKEIFNAENAEEDAESAEVNSRHVPSIDNAGCQRRRLKRESTTDGLLIWANSLIILRQSDKHLDWFSVPFPPMADERTLTHENFSLLLSWLDAEADAAAERYERIRARLIRVFVGRGCHEPEYLADLTFDRVAAKIPELDKIHAGDPAAYFLAVAKNIYHEWLRDLKQVREARFVDLKADGDDDRDAEYECLEDCLAGLAADAREMIVEYYRGEQKTRIQRRKSLASSLGISLNALQIKACRVRFTLLDCVRECAAEN